MQESNVLRRVEGRKLTRLLYNPSAGLKLDPSTEWIYGLIGAAGGTVGFYVWIWSIEKEITRNLLGGLDGVIEFGFLDFAASSKLLFLGLCSIILLAAALHLTGNRAGARKRTWLETATYQGSSQLVFAAGWLIGGALAFVSLKVSILLGIVLLLVNLLAVTTQAAEMHQVSDGRRLPFLAVSIVVYTTALYALVLLVI